MPQRVNGEATFTDCEHVVARLCWRAKFHDDEVPIEDACITQVATANAMQRCARGVVDEVVIKIQRLALVQFCKRRQPSSSGREHRTFEEPPGSGDAAFDTLQVPCGGQSTDDPENSGG